MRVLFCTDGSKTSLETLRNASKWLGNAIMDIICVIDWTFLPDTMSIEKEDYLNLYDEIAERVLDFTEKECRELGVIIGEKIKKIGSAAENILEHELKENYSMVLVGSHGKKGLQKWLGSVSRQIVHRSKIPVYTSKKTNQSQKVLFTIDENKHNCEITQKALKLINLENKEVYFCTVIKSHDFIFLEATFDKDWVKSIENERKIKAANAIKVSKLLVGENNLEIKAESILYGEPAEEILTYATNNNIDLIIMGSHSSEHNENVLIGSVSKRVLENTSSDVLIIK